MTHNAIIYIRFSTKKQEQGASKDRQLEDCQAYCERKGWKVIEVVEDLGRSAYKGHHLSDGNLGKLAERIRAGEFPKGTVLVVEKLDRISRQEPRKTQRWMEDLCDEGIRIATVSGDRIFDTDTLRASLMDTFEILMKAKLAHDESEQKSARIRDAWERKRQKAQDANHILTPAVPGWLQPREEPVPPGEPRFEIIEERAAVVRRIFEMTANGMGYWSIARKLNEEQTPSWGRQRKGYPKPGWNYAYISQLLKSPAVEGDHLPTKLEGSKRVLSGTRLTGYYPRIVDADLVNRARAATLDRKKHSAGGRYAAMARNLFASISTCNACGSPMAMRSQTLNNGFYSYIACDSAARKKGCEHGVYYNYKVFEQAALDAILHLALDDTFFSKPDSTSKLVNQVAETKKLVADKKEQSSRLIRLLARMDNPEVEAELEALNRETREAEQRLEQLEQDLIAAKGQVSPAEHLKRVMEVRDAMNSPDPEIVSAARLKVRDAIKSVVSFVRFNPVDDCMGKPQRTITMVLAGGAMGIKFDNKGNIIQQFNLAGALKAGDQSYTLNDGSVVTTNTDALRRGITGEDERTEKQLDNLLRRDGSKRANSQ